jgi:hypothetical protein
MCGKKSWYLRGWIEISTLQKAKYCTMTDLRKLINIIEDNSSVTQLKTDIIQQVKKTTDEELLDKIYTVLNKSGLTDRISGTLTRDTDTTGYVTDLTDLIINTPGSYQEKHDFINGFPTGYVDIEKMLSGKRVKFEALLTGGPFVRKVFDQLKRVTFGTSKGPGEFALAVMSPHILITGKGDLNIGDKIIEVKASAGKDVSSGGGRLGTPGLLHSDNVESIIVKHLKINMTKAVPGGNLSIQGLIQLCTNATPAVKKSLATELFGYIFKKEVPVTRLVSAFVAGDIDATKQEYVKANYALYQKDSGFTGIMLMNFALGEIKYYVDPAEMIKEVYDPGVYLISKDKAAQARQVLSQVTLRPFTEPPVVVPDAPGTGKSTAKAQTEYENKLKIFATEWARRQGITDATTVDQIASTVKTDLAKGMTKENILKKLKRLYKPTAPVADQTAPGPTPAKSSTPPVQPNANPAPVAGPASDELRFSESRRVPRGVSEPRHRR